MVDRIKTGHSEFAPGTREARFEKDAYDVFTSATIELEPADVGESLHTITTQRDSIVGEILLGAVSITSWVGVTGAVLALLSKLMSVFSIEIDPTLAEGSFLCPGETCVITAGLSVLTAMEWVVATVGFAIGFFGQLGVHVVRSGRVRARSEKIQTELTDAEADRFLVTGLGRATFKLGERGILIEGQYRSFLLNWKSIDIQRLYYPTGSRLDPKFPNIQIDPRPKREELADFIDTGINTAAFKKLREALANWAGTGSNKRAYIDLPVRNPRQSKTRVREWLRLPRDAFTAESSELGWIGVLAVIWLCAENEYDPDHVGYPEATES